MLKKRKIIVVLGPTASGKSALALTLAKKFNGFLISADSRQIYRKMDIGTNKDLGVWQNGKFFVDGIREELIDMIEPDEYFSVDNWVNETKKIIKKEKGLPIIVGGTGLYISALVENYELAGDYDEKIRKEVEDKYKKFGLEFLIKEMKKVDPEIENKIEIKNPRRMLRAGEIIFQTNKPLEMRKAESEFEVLQIGNNIDKEILFAKIDKRVDQMIEQGLIDEVRNLKNLGYEEKSSAISGIGYRQIYRFLNNEISGIEAVRLIKRDSRRFAKRQLTWFCRDKSIKWVNDETEAVVLAEKFFRDSLI
ncbi:MAG: tRNA (adenosine(37)-N6)-dimethylallyltransferase MiaA [Patescibacteria group bacterium]